MSEGRSETSTSSSSLGVSVVSVSSVLFYSADNFTDSVHRVKTIYDELEEKRMEQPEEENKNPDIMYTSYLFNNF